LSIRPLLLAIVLVLPGMACPAAGQTPGFHHLHLNSTDPEAAIDFYTKHFQSTSRTTWGGQPALISGGVLILFNKVETPPALAPQTALWHFGWGVTDERATLARFLALQSTFVPQWTGDGDNFVSVSSDTWPPADGSIGRTRAQIEDAKTAGIKPKGGGGFAYMNGPDGAIIEVSGNVPVERFTHVHMLEDDPLCAQLWYEKHLNAKRRARNLEAPVTEAACKVPRGDRVWPSMDKRGIYNGAGGGVVFSDAASNEVGLYIRPDDDAPLVSSLGHLSDHVALSVADLDAWFAKLKREGVTILMPPYKLGDTRAFMFEGPSKEALELVEVK